MINLTHLPNIGDKYTAFATVNTVTAIVPTLDVDDNPTVKIVLSHPLAGELHLPYDAWVTYITRGTFTKEES